MRWKPLAEIYTMHLNRIPRWKEMVEKKKMCTPLHRFRISIFRSKFCEFFVKFWHFLLFFSMILLDFFEILLKFRWNFWKFHGNPLNLQISMNFRGCRDKTQTQMREETQRRPDCPPPRWRWGFGGRKRTLPSSVGGREKTKNWKTQQLATAQLNFTPVGQLASQHSENHRKANLRFESSTGLPALQRQGQFHRVK